MELGGIDGIEYLTSAGLSTVGMWEAPEDAQQTANHRGILFSATKSPLCNRALDPALSSP